ncbi:Retrotransposable element Tf2 155 kDa protein type 1 [Ceratocystis lukuohia]|uniref:RNA-directed DNA polymerase n=2 Tax=Ceratocystis lukuohia TaxID=2019550 RepID=A0ABR4MUT2_9PEZI
MIDTGSASPSMITLSLVQKWKIATHKASRPIRLSPFNSKDPVTVNTVAIFTLDVSGQKENHVAWVVPELAEDLLIGYPWLKKKGALIDCEKDTVTFKSGIVAHGKLTNAPNFRSTLEQIYDVTKILHTVSQDSLHVFMASIDDINKALDRLQRDRQPADPNVWKKKVPHWIDTENVKAFDPDAQFTKKLPPRRPGHDHKIELTVPDEEAPWGPLYSMTREELVVLRQTLLALLEKGYIEESQSTAAAPILFVKKPGGGLRFCVDYRALNAVMKKNRYPLPNITETLKNVSKAKWFTKLDVVSAFHNIRIAEGDEWKTAFRTRHGLFQWKVMPFGLANAPAEFQSFLNSLLRPYLDVWLSAYVDDILIYTDGTLEDHYEKVNLALKKILEGKLTIDIDKCEFAVTKVKYLGYILEPGSVSTDPSKVSAVTEWPTPKKIRDVRSFLGLCNFYRSFIPDFTKLANPLLQLTKKDQAFQWGVQEDEAFQELKTAFTTTPILCTHDPELPTIVEADASGYCLGAALLQKQADNSTRPCAYFSRKMTAAECNYPIHDKEMLGIICALKEWRSELKGLRDEFTILSDHKNLLHFTKLQHLSERQTRWYLTLSEYNCSIVHRPGKLSPLPDALSRRDTPDDASDERYQGRLVTMLHGDSKTLKICTTGTQQAVPSLPPVLRELWVEACNSDEMYAEIHRALTEGLSQWPETIRTKLRVNVSDCSLDADSAVRFRNKLWVPEYEPLRTAVLQNIHDSPTLLHPGKNTMQVEFAREFFWPRYVEDIRRFCRNCQVCGSTNIRRDSKETTLKALPIPDQPWAEIAIDFIGPLEPAQKGGIMYTHILTIVDRLTKGVMLIPTNSLDMESVADSFFQHYYRIHGMPKSILSDREFVNAAWRHLCKRLDIERLTTTAYHPATNGAAERMNAEIKTKLAKLNAEGPAWLNLLPTVEFSLNATPSAATNVSPFFLLHGYHPRTFSAPPLPAEPNENGPLGQAERVMQHLRNAQKWAHANLSLARAEMEQRENEDRRPAPDFPIGSFVWLTLRPEQQGQGLGRKLRQKHQRCKVLERVTPHTYRLEVPGSRSHDVYHVDRLRLAANDPFPSQDTHNSQPQPMGVINGENYWEVEKVLGERTHRDNKQVKVKWKGYTEATWEPIDALLETDAYKQWCQEKGQTTNRRRRRRG